MDLLTDEVWARLDPHAGRLSRRQAWRLWLAVLACVVLLGAAVDGWRSGLVRPRFEPPSSQPSSADFNPQAREFTLHLPLMNRGVLTETILVVGRSGPGLVLQAPTDTFPLRLAPNTGRDVSLRYRVTDCDAVPAGDWPIPVRVSRPWGSVTTGLLGPSFGGQAPWQRKLADGACGRG
jgi:hypothetical protein